MDAHPVEQLLPLLNEHHGRLAAEGPVAMASDGDHTLWKGDVGEAMFEMAIEDGKLRPEAATHLASEAHTWGVAIESDDPNAIGKALLAAHRADRYPPQPAFAMMAWAFAGWPLEELDGYCEEFLDRFGFDDRKRASLTPALDWAAEHDVPFWLVSASPLFIAAAAALRLGLPKERVVAMTPAAAAGVLLPYLGVPATYGPGKPARLAERSDAKLLAGMGDSDYDLALMEAAAIAVAVGSKPSLHERLKSLAGPVVLVED